MDYIKKDDLVKILTQLIESRAGKNCSRQYIMERQIYQYVLNIVNALSVRKIDE